MKEKQSGLARYIKIAEDICQKIVQEEFKEGDLIKGRSVLASFYNVSSETVRKAINILAKEGVVQIKRGVGIFVLSTLHAQEFLQKREQTLSINDKYVKLQSLLDEKKKIDKSIEESIKDIKDSFTFQTKEKVELLEINVPNSSWIIGKTIGEVYFYNYTEATIAAVMNIEGIFITSPGPDYIFKQEDRIIFVPKDKLTFDRVASFLVYGVEND